MAPFESMILLARITSPSRHGLISRVWKRLRNLPMSHIAFKSYWGNPCSLLSLTFKIQDGIKRVITLCKYLSLQLQSILMSWASSMWITPSSFIASASLVWPGMNSLLWPSTSSEMPPR
jgi:hypothetical protein